jgi:pimeloyl-ACP methyl ester carboxylesterase
MKIAETRDHRSFTTAFQEPHARLDLPGGRLAYYRFGKGPDVVAIHGWPLHAATFRALLPYLADHFTIHLFDLPGTGHTEWNAPPSFAVDTDAIRLGIDALGLTRFALLAHDSGGVMARLVAAGDTRVRGLVLSDTEIPGHHAWLLQVFVAVARVPSAARLYLAAQRFGPVRRSMAGFGTCFTDPAFVDDEFGDLFVRPLADERVARGQMGLLQGFRFEDIDRLAESHARITAPTLCVWGDRDPFFPIAKARAMLPSFAGGARLAAIPGAKLFSHEDHPAEYAAHAVPFLARCFGEANATAVS